MASNSFGSLIRITTWGESHGAGIGVVLDGFPSGVELSEDELFKTLERRAPGRGKEGYTSPRKESDRAEFLSGLFQGRSTGAPIAIWVKNSSFDSKPYEELKEVLRPGHLSFTYAAKYSNWDYRGGGRASARETIARVAAGYCVRKWLFPYGIQVTGWMSQIGTIQLAKEWELDPAIHSRMEESRYHFFSPEESFSLSVEKELSSMILQGDSVGGIVTCRIDGLPAGLGDPVYEKIEAKLASAMLSIPASKGFEIGEGFKVASMRGSEYLDGFYVDNPSNAVRPSSNRAGGTIAGISTGESIIFRVAFKPTSSIRIPIQTVNRSKEMVLYQTPIDGKHDPCVAIRAVPVVEAMAFLVVGDLFALSKSINFS
ncbi:MAG: chorismate synthase [Chlamydia sp.]